MNELLIYAATSMILKIVLLTKKKWLKKRGAIP